MFTPTPYLNKKPETAFDIYNGRDQKILRDRNKVETEWDSIFYHLRDTIILAESTLDSQGQWAYYAMLIAVSG